MIYKSEGVLADKDSQLRAAGLAGLCTQRRCLTGWASAPKPTSAPPWASREPQITYEARVLFCSVLFCSGPWLADPAPGWPG